MSAASTARGGALGGAGGAGQDHQGDSRSATICQFADSGGVADARRWRSSRRRMPATSRSRSIRCPGVPDTQPYTLSVVVPDAQGHLTAVRVPERDRRAAADAAVRSGRSLPLSIRHRRPAVRRSRASMSPAIDDPPPSIVGVVQQIQADQVCVDVGKTLGPLGARPHRGGAVQRGSQRADRAGQVQGRGHQPLPVPTATRWSASRCSRIDASRSSRCAIRSGRSFRAPSRFRTSPTCAARRWPPQTVADRDHGRRSGRRRVGSRAARGRIAGAVRQPPAVLPVPRRRRRDSLDRHQLEERGCRRQVLVGLRAAQPATPRGRSRDRRVPRRAVQRRAQRSAAERRHRDDRARHARRDGRSARTASR